jgi:hypothetical protein
VPVILSDAYAPPGDPGLWQQAAVFCPETSADVQALPDRLEQMARDKPAMAKRHAALRQLWLLYGPKGFVSDILERMHDLANRPLAAHQALAVPESLAPQAADMLTGQPSHDQVEDFVVSATSLWLLDPVAAATRLAPQTAPGKALILCRDRLPKGHSLRDHLDQIETAAKLRTPALATGKGPLIHIFDDPTAPVPLTHGCLQNLVGNRARFTTGNDMTGADIILTSGAEIVADVPVLTMAETAEALPMPHHLPYALCLDPWRLPRLLTLLRQTGDEDASGILARWQAAPLALAQADLCNTRAAHLAQLTRLNRRCFGWQACLGNPLGPDADILDALACGASPQWRAQPSDLLQSWLAGLRLAAQSTPNLALAEAHIKARNDIFTQLSLPNVLLAARRQLVDALLARIFERLGDAR